MTKSIFYGLLVGALFFLVGCGKETGDADAGPEGTGSDDTQDTKDNDSNTDDQETENGEDDDTSEESTSEKETSDTDEDDDSSDNDDVSESTENDSESDEDSDSDAEEANTGDQDDTGDDSESESPMGSDDDQESDTGEAAVSDTGSASSSDVDTESESNENGGSDTGSGNDSADDTGSATGNDSEQEIIPDDNIWYLSERCELDGASNGWGPIEKNLSNGEQEEKDGGPLIIAGSVYSKGLGMHAPAEVSYSLGGACDTFSAEVGIDEEMKGAGSVIFEVWGDGERLYQSDTLEGPDDPVSVQVNVEGVQELRLVADEGEGNGSDHADWGDAKVHCTEPPGASCPAPMDDFIAIPSGYDLTWSDEFNVEGLPNTDDWGYERGYVRNEEWQEYTDNNAFQKAGFLIIQGRRETASDGNYTSSSLVTVDIENGWMPKQSFQYGIFEMRARIVAEPGLWPAFWTLGTVGGWPSQGEIDIMEYYNDRIHANMCWGSGGGTWDSESKLVSDFGEQDWDAQFHIWRMEWDANEIVLSVDGEVINRGDVGSMSNSDGSYPFRTPHKILVNLAIGGTAGGNADNTYFPTHYVIDYVRVFQGS